MRVESANRWEDMERFVSDVHADLINTERTEELRKEGKDELLAFRSEVAADLAIALNAPDARLDNDLPRASDSLDEELTRRGVVQEPPPPAVPGLQRLPFFDDLEAR